MSINETTTRDQAEIELRLWLAPILDISVQATYELLHDAYDTELLEIDALQAAAPKDRLQGIKVITSQIYGRRNTPAA